jgi:hypothetical protein
LAIDVISEHALDTVLSTIVADKFRETWFRGTRTRELEDGKFSKVSGGSEHQLPVGNNIYLVPGRAQAVQDFEANPRLGAKQENARHCGIVPGLPGRPKLSDIPVKE